MTTPEHSSPSGSRWEPAPDAPSGTGSGDTAVDDSPYTSSHADAPHRSAAGGPIDGDGGPTHGGTSEPGPAPRRGRRRAVVATAVAGLLALGGGAAFATGHALTDDGPPAGVAGDRGAGGPGGPGGHRHGHGPGAGAPGAQDPAVPSSGTGTGSAAGVPSARRTTGAGTGTTDAITAGIFT